MHALYWALFGAALAAWPSGTCAFSPALPNPLTPSAPYKTSTSLCGGVGVAETYSWNEEQFELEVKIPVPPGTAAKDVKFKCSSESIDLRLRNCNSDDGNTEKVLLDGARNMRGKICVDGTFWSIEGNNDNREITITIEKHFVPVSSSGGAQTFDTLTDFDWGGVYPNDEEEVSHRKYDEPEELNVREYAAKLGVDIDNIDMSKVDKTMFGAGLGGDAAEAAAPGTDESAVEEGDSGEGKGYHFNITQTTLDQLTKVGLAKEVVQQRDGTEYEMGADGSLSEDNLFSMLGKDVSSDELREAGIMGGGNIPPLWETSTVPVEEAPGYQNTDGIGNAEGLIESEVDEREITAEDGVVDVAGTVDEVREEAIDVSGDHDDAENATEEDPTDDDPPVVDPIDTLTVARLKEILREQGLKVSGKKQDLRDRLRNHVNALLQEE